MAPFFPGEKKNVNLINGVHHLNNIPFLFLMVRYGENRFGWILHNDIAKNLAHKVLWTVS